MTEENYGLWWGLVMRSANGDVYDLYSFYGEDEVVYWKMVNGMMVPL